jgi:putative phosphonate metabolism protein
MSARYALYFAPQRGSALSNLGAQWLGRDPESGAALAQPKLEGWSPARVQELTDAPRHYGFHGTLKPPFHLAAGADLRELRGAVESFVARQAAFALPGLALKAIGDFLALVPADTSPDLSRLAQACVIDFDSFRAPPEPAELAKRHAAGLSMRQGELLARWGYPYVMDEFRFHLTLTGPVKDAAERGRLAQALQPLLAPVLPHPVPIAEICLFQQPSRTAPFRLTDRFPFGQ